MARKKKNETAAQVENEAPEGETAAAATNVENASAGNAKATCLVPDCGREAASRGSCPRCLTAARKAIKDGKTTFEKLESLGLAIAPKHKTFGGEPGLFSKVLAAKLGQTKD